MGTALLAVASMVALPAATATAAPSSVDVFVGYADTLRANVTHFPTPWDGAPDVVFAGCHANCTFDAGAARFVNNSPGAVTIDFVHIRLSTCTFDMWPHGTVLQEHQQLVVTQTATGAADGCDNSAGFFDTSDIGPNGTEWAGHCDQSGVIPQIDLSVNGVVQTFTDSGQVLNTGGVDLASCPPGSNESTQWTSIGSVPCPGATLTLAPPTQTQPIGSPATVQATLQNTCGTGLQGAPVTFTVQSGPNAGTTGSGVTDVNGVASFPYTGTTTGTDTVVATTTNPAGTITSNTVNVLWERRHAQLVITGGATTSDFNDPATVAAVLTDSQGPLPGRTVTFTLNGAETCSGTTNASGAASCSLTPGEPAGPYPLVASFAGDATDTDASATATFTVTLEETTLAYTGPTRAANGEPITLSGVLKEDGTAPINGRTVTFTIGTGGSAQSCTGTTNAAGAASCTIASVNQPVVITTVPVTAVFAGDAFYLPASAAATLRFQYLTGRAYGLASSGLVGISPTPDTGSVSTAGATTVAPPCVATIGGLITAHTLCAKVVTSLNPGKSTATASLQDARVGVLGLPVIQVGVAQSSSQTTCAGSSGQATITSISVGGIPVNVDLHPAPNTTVTVLGVQLVFNEQTPVAGADQGLTVNAVHIKALGLLDTTIASATSDIHNC
ncbi:Ig-like domain-containing protein [Actinocrispum wychmicini]|uniref:Ig-like domain-containing protein n=1 Tax=Actinocrispum wychmicini TaxID=1213861 RepID=UPI00140560E6|nr:Ig-like domain-containing protein [Actinocrispum wychmicini]